jgi:hypothetical protein
VISYPAGQGCTTCLVVTETSAEEETLSQLRTACCWSTSAQRRSPLSPTTPLVCTNCRIGFPVPSENVQADGSCGGEPAERNSPTNWSGGRPGSGGGAGAPVG